MESDPIGLLGGVNTYTYVGSSPLSGIDPYGLSNLMLGGNVSAILAAGFTLSGGIYVSWGENFDIGVYGAAGGGLGVNVGAGVSMGYVPGSSKNIAGQTVDLQASVGPITASGSIATTTDSCHDLIGSGSIGLGVGLPLGADIATTGTATFGLSNIINWIGGN